ncbi:glycosyltransferase [Flagellimonas oceanensis]|uniref:glycosyltransferase n=1 Tax=Flagellimonas oceanensis TaxID=2499163 RepID=UPI000F8D070C|nr:glycosyltransferase [Allomuricauda oceanensis]
MSHSPIKIVFVIPSLVAGGAEKVISFISQHLNEKEFETTLLVLSGQSEQSYTIKKIDVIYLGQDRVLYSIPKIVQVLRKLSPNIVMSSISHLNTAMAIISPLFRKTKFVGREATILSARKKTKKRFYPKSLTKYAYKRLNTIVCQSKDMAQDMVNNFSVPKHKIQVINNPISNYGDIKPETNNPFLKFITVGRLVEIKGHLRILNILSKLDEEFEYTIIGNGNLRDEIFSRAESLGLKDKITHIPYTNEVNKYLMENDYFLQGSYVEGFPNALLESCVVGTPVIAFDVPGGTKEIVENGINGWLVNTEEEYIAKLEKKIDWDPEGIRESVLRKFSTDKIINEYEVLFKRLVQS